MLCHSFVFVWFGFVLFVLVWSGLVWGWVGLGLGWVGLGLGIRIVDWDRGLEIGDFYWAYGIGVALV